MNTPYQRYPLYNNGRFSNHIGEKSESVFWRSLIMFVQSWVKRRKQRLDLADWYAQESNHEKTGIQWIGHASFLIKHQGMTMITDPVFGDLSFLFKRILQSAYAFEQAPFVDVVLISHNHRDHLDERSIRALVAQNPKIQFLVPWGDKKWFIKRGYTRVRECMWWEEVKIAHHDQPYTFTFLPAFHWSQRGLFDRNRALWGSWLIKHDLETIYFAGDTAWGSHFAEIAHFYPSIDVALMPIAPCEPHQWMKVSHMNAEEAVEAFLHLNARTFIPMHWGAYWFGTDEFSSPIERLHAYWSKQENLLINKELRLLKVGEWQNTPPVRDLYIPEERQL